MTLDLGLYVVADPTACRPRGVRSTVMAAVRGGATVVQLRHKDGPARETCALAAAVLDDLRPTGVPLVVNDRLDVALAVGAHGVHLGQGDLPPEHARRLAGPDLFVGWSVSCDDDVRQAEALARGTVDYLGVGPVFPTGSKEDAAPALGLDGLTGLVASTDLPCVAIGGIDRSTVAAVRRTGVRGVAVVSAVCGAPDPYGAAAALAGGTS